MQRLVIFLIGLIVSLPTNLLAEEGHATPWQLGFQKAASPVMEKVDALHDLLLIIIFAIGIFVTALVGYVCWRFHEKRNKKPATFTHNTKLEVIWTLVPVLILLVIAVPSLKMLYYMDHTEKADLTIKVIGHQWYWSYEYPDHGNFSFDSYIIPDKELTANQIRLLSVDNPVVVPVGKNVRLLATSGDVIHSWAVPSLGVKKDTVPGKLNETWFRIIKPGIYYGQCSELCGPGHGFMPIAVKAVSEEEFKQWVEKAKEQYA